MRTIIRRINFRGLVLCFSERNSKGASTTQLSLYMHTIHILYMCIINFSYNLEGSNKGLKDQLTLM